VQNESGAVIAVPHEHTTDERLRKLIHISFGLCAILLRWLSWQQAAGVAALAVVGNWLLLHRVAGKAVARHQRGWDAGILLYPFAVMILILLFRHHLMIAGTVWVILAFGDGCATLAGRAFGEARLPWNPEKSWIGFLAFVGASLPTAWAISYFLDDNPTVLPRSIIILLTVAACAIAESLPMNIDDNLTVPLAGGITMAILATAQHLPAIAAMQSSRSTAVWLVVNTLLAVLGYAAKSVDLSGTVGGCVLGAIILVFGGWRLYVVLLLFFVIGTASTKLGYRSKAARGLAQEKEGRRGFSHAFSNVGVAAICAISFSMASGGPFGVAWKWLAAVAALATAAADTTASEIGQLLGRRAFLPVTLRSVSAGTEGAISAEGTFAGLLAGFVVSFVGAALLVMPSKTFTMFATALTQVFDRSATRFWIVVLLLTLCAFAGSYIECVAGNWNRKQARPIPNGVLNFFNTLIGALLAMLVGPYVLLR
jgi:uncharacterized protein (TIGR00297 family)